jgi:hypothetical protein
MHEHTEVWTAVRNKQLTRILLSRLISSHWCRRSTPKMMLIDARLNLIKFLTAIELKAWMPGRCGISRTDCDMYLLSTGAEVEPIQQVRYILLGL